MEVYLVGGAIRDQLLGLPVKERDWVVVGGTPEELIAQQYLPVGKEFPVFLHPYTKEEYALARTEHKTARGYKGFAFYAAPDVSLEQDLERRDLTINAMAQASDGKIVDPFNGRADLEKKILRHVSPAFAEDPVRILRVARFAAKFSDFSVDPTTNKLMQQMVENGEVDALVPERVWKELQRALTEKDPTRFFQVLADCNALPALFPQINLAGNGFQTLKKIIKQNLDAKTRFAVLTYDLALEDLKNLCQRYKLPREYSELALLIVEWFHSVIHASKLNATEILHVLRSTDALRRPERFQEFLEICVLCMPESEINVTVKQLFISALIAVQSVDITPLQQKKFKGQEFGHALHELQVAAIQEILKSNI